MRAYKGFNINESGQLICQGMVYEVGKTYKYEGQIELCARGYHACEKFEDVLDYYPYENGETKYYEVECHGDIIKSYEDSKIVCSEITLIEELHGWWEEYDYAGGFQEGLSRVELNDKWNYINTEGKLVSNQWFDCAYSFSEGFAMIELNDKWNFINKEGKLVSNQWFDVVGYFFNEGFAMVELNDKWNYINTEGKLVSNQWFDCAYSFSEGFAMIELNDKRNFINQEGRLLSNQWFDDAYSFRVGFAAVKLNGKWYKIDTEGNLHKVKEE